MAVFVFRDGQYVDKRTGEPMLSAEDRAKPLAAPKVISDLPAYASPLGDGVIDGRAARREHFRRTNTREVDPSEWADASKKFKASYEEKKKVVDEWKASKRSRPTV